MRGRVDGNLRRIREQPGQQIKHEIFEVSQVVFHVVSENKEKPHVAQYMLPPFMQKHRSEKGQNGLHQVVMRIPDVRRHERKLVEEILEPGLAELKFKEENQNIQGDQEPIHKWRAVSRLIVFYGEHGEFGNLVIGKLRK